MFILAIAGAYFFFVAYYFYKHYRVRCFCVDCKHNLNGHCSQKVVVYDNSGIKGLCLYHSTPTFDRVKVVLEKGVEIGKGKLNDKEAISKIEDSLAIKSPEEFKEWMKKHGADQK